MRLLFFSVITASPHAFIQSTWVQNMAACCPLSCVSWIPPAFCSPPLKNCSPALSCLQLEPLSAAPEGWQLATVMVGFFTFAPCQVSLFSFWRLQPIVFGLAPAKAGGRQPAGSAARCLQPGRGSVENWVSSGCGAWHQGWFFFFPHSCSSHLVQPKKGTILNVLAVHSLSWKFYAPL